MTEFYLALVAVGMAAAMTGTDWIVVIACVLAALCVIIGLARNLRR